MAQPQNVAQNFLLELADPEAAEIDIVAVHGLNPVDTKYHAYETWTAGDKLWLRDFLPKRLPKARILLFGYNANVAFRTSTLGVRQQANNLLNRLKLKRPADLQRPILFICHSLGGIIVEQALIEARLNSGYSDIIDATCAIVFFATPHRGGNFATLGSVAAKIAQKVLRNPDNTFMEAIKTDSLYSKEIGEGFNRLVGRFKILSFFESKYYGNVDVIVTEESAVLEQPDEERLGIEANHIDICRFDSERNDAYIQVEGNIVLVATEAVRARTNRLRLADLTTAAPLVTPPASEPPEVRRPRNSNSVQGASRRRVAFSELTDEMPYFQRDTTSYWGHLTIEGLEVYREIFRACKDERGQVGCTAFTKQFNQLDPPPHKLQLVWKRVQPTLEGTLNRSLAMAILYMLHVEKYLDETPKDAHGGVGIKPDRRRSLKRFDKWVPCCCRLACGRKWNFANDIGLVQGNSLNQPCQVARWIEKSAPRERDDEQRYYETMRKWKEIGTIGRSTG